MIRYPLLTLLLLAGCTATPEKSPNWQEIPSPNPAATVRDIVHCGDSWIAVGSMRLGADPSVAPNEEQSSAFRPAAWRYRAGAWQEVPVKPLTHYGIRAILRQVTCRGDDFAAMGGASGGAHGNLRITTWLAKGSGELVQNPLEDTEMFGGGSAIGVEQMVAIESGYVMAGNWLHASGRAGPAVWFSPDGRTWSRLPEDPLLASTPSVKRQANGAVGLGDQVLLLGEERKGGKDLPFAAMSSDGRMWRPLPLQGEGSLLAGSGTVLVAWRGQKLATWLFHEGQWRADGEFGYGEGTQPPRVTGVTDSLIGGCAGSTCQLWQRSGSGWAATKLPAPLAATPTSLVLLSSDGKGSTMLVLTDGNNLRIFREGRAA
jgi:hypothetical protein